MFNFNYIKWQMKLSFINNIIKSMIKLYIIMYNFKNNIVWSFYIGVRQN